VTTELEFPDYESQLAADGPDTGPGQQLGAEPLDQFLARERRFAVAFSGGTDSALLLAAAVFLFIPLLFLITAVIRYVRWTYRFDKAKIPEKVEEAVEKHREERLEKKLENKAGGDGDG